MSYIKGDFDFIKNNWTQLINDTPQGKTPAASLLRSALLFSIIGQDINIIFKIKEHQAMMMRPENSENGYEIIKAITGVDGLRKENIKYLYEHEHDFNSDFLSQLERLIKEVKNNRITISNQDQLINSLKIELLKVKKERDGYRDSSNRLDRVKVEFNEIMGRGD